MENQVILGDCLEELKKIPDNYIDLVLTDPPYNISQNGNAIIRKTLSSKSMKRNSNIKLDYGEWDKRSEPDFKVFTEDWFKECARVLKEKSWMYVFFSKERIGHIIDLSEKYGLKVRTVFTWVKSNPVPSFRKVNYVSATEFCVVFSKGDCKIKNFLKQVEMNNYMITPNKSSYGETTHPTEKPLAVFRRFITQSSNPNELVLDPFAGSGTTGVACEELGRNYILIEREREYYDIILERIKKFKEQKSLELKNE